MLNNHSAIFQLYHGENKSIHNEMMMNSTLYWTNTLNCIVIVLVHWNNSLRIALSLHSETLFWFRPNQSLFFLLNDAYLAEKQQIPILLPLVWLNRGSKLRVNKVQIYRPEILFYSFSNFEWHSLELVVQLQHLART